MRSKSSCVCAIAMVSALLAAVSAVAKDGAPTLSAWYRLFDHSAQVTIDYSGLDPKLYAGAKLEATCITSDGKVLGKAAASHMPTNLLAVPLKEKLADGNYYVEVLLTDASGKRSVFSLPFSRKKSEWEDNGIGVTDKVIGPWTPMTVQGSTASCWGRQYTFGTLGLPSQILSTQPDPTRGAATRKLLASPVDLVVETPKGKLKWTSPRTTLTRRSEGYVDVLGTAETPRGEIRAALSGTLEFDGFYKFALRITPTQPISVSSIRLEVPLPDDIACLFNTVGEAMRSNHAFLDLEGKPDGELWNSYNPFSLQKYLTNSQKVLLDRAGPGDGFPRGYAGKWYPPFDYIGTFYPHIWLGDDDRGIAFMGDNDRGWVLDYTKPCQDVVRKGGKTFLRLLLVNSPVVLDKPVEATLSLQATPVKPRPRGGSYKNIITYGWSQFDKPHVFNGCFAPYEKGGGEKWYANEDAKKEDRWWRYFCFYTDRLEYGESYAYKMPTSDYAPDWAVHKEEWLSGSDYGWFGPASAHISSNADWRMWWYKKWHDVAGMDGLYYDNTYPHVTTKLGPGIAWEDETGRIHPSFVMFANRDYIKRVRTYFLDQGPAPVLYTHMTDAPVIGYLGFADMWLDGENGGRPECTAEQEVKWAKALDFVDRWGNPGGLANLRVTLGRQWGVAPKYLYTWQFDPTQTVLGMFDLDNCYTRMNGLGDRFGLKEEDVVFIPYWDKRKYAKVMEEESVLATLWSRPGRARVLLSNLTRYDKTVDVKLDLKKLGLPGNAVAVDDQTGEGVALVDGMLKGVLIDSHNYRAVIVAAPGVFAPNPTGGELVQGKRIESLCDDFRSIGGWKKLGSNVGQWKEMLRVDSRDTGMVIRPFGQDNCSVQVKVQAAGVFWDSYPSIKLFWSNDTYVGVTAGYGAPMPDGPHDQSVAKLSGKALPNGVGHAAGAVNWMKITLSPDTIVFSSSADGKSWTQINSIPRAGFEGAPAFLTLGRGDLDGAYGLVMDKDRGDGRCYFDDLITWR